MNKMEQTDIITRFIVKSIEREIPGGIKNIYVVGSLPFGEETILSGEGFDSDQIYISDFDIIIDVNVVTFVKCYLTSISKKLSEMTTARLRLQGFKTHVSVSIFPLRLSNFVKFVGPNTVYLYELAPIVLNRGKYVPSLTSSTYMPKKLDSLNLIFSAIADYLFTEFELFENLTPQEKCYVIAKRCLTVLYSLLLFSGLHSRSYARRIKTVKKHFDKLDKVLSPDDVKILQILTQFKLSGKLNTLKELPINDMTIDNMLVFLDDYFRELTEKVLLYELKAFTLHNEVYDLEKYSHLGTLLKEYKSKVRIPFILGLVYASLQIAVFLRDRNRDRLRTAVYSLLIRRLKIGDLLRYLVGFTFINTANEKKSEIRFVVGNIKPLWDLFMI